MFRHLGNVDPNSGEGTPNPVGNGTVDLSSYFGQFGIGPGTVPATGVDDQLGKRGIPTAPTTNPASFATMLQQYSTAIFLGSSALFFLAVMSGRSRR